LHWCNDGVYWLISLCANADAFAAKSFYGQFTTGSMVTFMTFGQMIDLKNNIFIIGFNAALRQQNIYPVAY